MYIRRKVFSKLQTEEGQEKYFSTTEFTLMSEAEQREFSKKKESEPKEEEEKEPKLAREDRKEIRRYGRKWNKKSAELRKKALEGDEDAQKKIVKRAYKKGMIGMGALGATAGALVGANDGKAAKGAAIGGAVGTGLGAAIATGVKSSWKHKKKIESRNPQAKIDGKIDHDRIAVSRGEMTKKEFVKKWGN